ncbi:MAG: hypothetical protein FJ125_01305 [Deltaproteobacteria bacterium]|nr:hypothetical protein [Deltaproteobacteria bacterium]
MDGGGGEDDDPPGGCIQGDFSPFFGNLHAHTSYSDGEGRPEEAFRHARDVAGLDIMFVTDHLEQLWLGLILDRWQDCRDAADEANEDGSYLAGCGFEYGSAFEWFQSTGHNNVFFEDRLFPAIQLNFHDFYRSIVLCDDCIGQFNHPGDDPAQHWHGFEYYPDADPRMNLFELNGSGPTWQMLFQALDAGWHLSPTNNQDNHSADWGSKNSRRTGFYLAELTREALHAAMRSRRSFATMDADATLRLMAGSVCWMGSILTGAGDLLLEAEAEDATEEDGFATLELFGPGATLLAAFDCAGQARCLASRQLVVDRPTYVVARATQRDGDWLVSAPIWVKP